MKCLRCGHCCIIYDVMIVKPEKATKDLDMSKIKPEDIIHKKGGEICPHLILTPEKATCKIHNFEWYKETPCYSHTQIERSKDSVCRLGEFVRKNNIIEKFIEERRLENE